MLKPAFIILSALLLLAVSNRALASQADDTVIIITSKTPGSTPFISQVRLIASNLSVLKSIQFTVTPKPGSVTRPLSGTYSYTYLLDRGDINEDTSEIFLPVYGLYDGFTNDVTFTYYFLDGSSKSDTTTIETDTFDDPCGYNNPTILQARTNSTSLSFDYMYLKGSCSDFSPTVLDTDGALRWVGAAGINDYTGAFFDNAFYLSFGTYLYRLELDGTITFLHDYHNDGFTYLHHNIDPGKVGLIIDVNTDTQMESVNAEIDLSGNVLKVWNLADIISAAMIAGGDDPSQFVFPVPNDWFHNNAVAYNRADDSLVISSRENFVICIDYETSAIKWILGDPTKAWYQYPSLQQYALTLADGSLPPIGQHSPSITADQHVMVFDNGFFSNFHTPPGTLRSYSAPRKYQIDLPTKTATEVWSYEMDQSVWSPICSSIYEDMPFNYLIDYAYVGGFSVETQYAQLLGLDAAGTKIFYYQYPTSNCDEVFIATPLHLENAKFPAIGPKALNLSTRGTISNDDNTLIGGFIVDGTENKPVVLRALGPSLGDSGITGFVPNPVLTVYDASGTPIATNDDWASDPAAGELTAIGLAPTKPLEAATEQTLAPAAYTVVATSKDGTSGVGLIEAYDVSAGTDSRLANISTRGFIGTDQNVLITGFIVGEVGSTTVVIRGLGPSLASSVSGALSDPMLTIYDSNGAVISSNDDWRDDLSMVDIAQIGLAPTDDAEATTILNPPAGAYTAIESGVDNTTGIGLIELYHLN